MTRTIDFWFEFASTYSYIAAKRAPKECEKHGVTLRYRPFLLGPIFTAQLGIKDSPFNVNPIRGRYMWRDIERLCTKHEIPFRMPTIFPRRSVRAGRLACLGDGQPWVSALIDVVFDSCFVRDEDIDDTGVLRRLLAELKLPPELLKAADSDAAKAQLRANTDAAQKAGLFGAPTFEVDGELFFGQDRLDDALAWATRS